MSPQNEETEEIEQIDMRFRRPESVVVSVRLNAHESRVLTAEARRAGEKLSTFLKQLAFEAIEARRRRRQGWAAVGGESGSLVILSAETQTWAPADDREPDGSDLSDWKQTPLTGATTG